MSKKYERKTHSARTSGEQRTEADQATDERWGRLAGWVGSKFAGGVLAGVGRELARALVDAWLSD